MIKKGWFSVLFLFAVFQSHAGEYKVRSVQDEQHLEVALRMIGHKFLLSLGDSTSRILPVKHENGSYIISVETEFQFDPESLVNLIEEEARSVDFPEQYIVEVTSCKSEEVVYAYEISRYIDSHMIPCQGRTVPKACYNIHFTFPDLTSTEEVVPAAPARFQFSGSWGLTAFILCIAGGISLFFSRKRDNPKSNAQLHSKQIGQFTFVPTTMELHLNGHIHTLTSKEADLLTFLNEHANATIKREQLLQEIWGNEDHYVGRTLDVFISRLRKKLEGDPDIKISNVRGVGYKLIIPNYLTES